MNHPVLPKPRVSVRKKKLPSQLDLGPAIPSAKMPQLFVIAGWYAPRKKALVAEVCDTEKEAELKLKKLSPRYQLAAVYCLNDQPYDHTSPAP